ncbi:MAG TPA: hypothetical protein VF384_03350 [Planctomycetota bacterium]
MRILSTLLGVIAVTSVSATAQSVLIPSTALGPFAGTSGNYFTAGGINHFQMIYDTSSFTTQGVLSPINITNVQFTYGGGATATNIVTYPLVSVYLQPAANDWASQSTTFAANQTTPLPTTPNFTGSVTTIPGANYVDIALTTPFAYDPTTGVDLLIEVEVNGAPTPALGNTQACTYSLTPPANACAVIRTVGSITNPIGAVSAFVPIVNLVYGPVPGAASYQSLGAGCIAQYASMYELFALPANWDLNGSALTFIPASPGYVAVRTGSFLPIGSVQSPPTALTLADDAETTVPFTVGSFVGASGPWANLTIVSNGVISEAAAHPASVAGGGAPNNNTYLNAAPTAFYCLADWDPSVATGGGNVWFEESAGVTTITWENVPNWVTTPPAPGVNTFQFQLYPSGWVTIAWTSVTSFGNNGGVLVGYSPGGVNLDPGSRDISAIGAGAVPIASADVPPLTLSATNRPVMGATWNLQVSNIEASSLVGLEIFGVVDPGINDLFFLGMPGCGLRATLDVANAFLVTGPTHNFSFNVPLIPSLQGFNLYTTTATMQGVPQNAFGWMTSNGIRGTLGPI